MYEKQQWRNNDTTTPISAARLEHMEQGIYDAHELEGPQGPAGVTGPAGHSPVVGVDESTYRLTVDGEQVGPSLRGPAGEPGTATTITTEDITTALKSPEGKTAVSETVGAVAVLKDKQPINVADYITPGDADHTEGLTKAAAAAKEQKRGLFLPDGVVLTINGKVDMRYVTTVDFLGQVKVGADGVLAMGHTSAQRPGQYIRVRDVSWAASSQTNVVLQLVGMKQAFVDVRKCSSLEFYADASDSTMSSVSYSTISLGQVTNLSLTGVGANAWITELVFLGGDMKNVTVKGQYEHNSITFFKPCFEGGTLDFQCGTRIRAVDARCESGTKVKFGERTNRIVIEDSFLSNPTSYSSGVTVVQNLGTDNMVVTAYDQYFRREEIGVSWKKPASGDVPAGSVAMTPKQWSYIMDTGVIPIRGLTPDISESSTVGEYSMTTFFMQSDAANWRPEVSLYGADGAALSNASGIDTTGGWTWDSATSAFKIGASKSSARIIVTDTTAAFIRIKVRAGTAQPYKILRLFGFIPSNQTDFPARIARESITITNPE